MEFPAPERAAGGTVHRRRRRGRPPSPAGSGTAGKPPNPPASPASGGRIRCCVARGIRAPWPAAGRRRRPPGPRGRTPPGSAGDVQCRRDGHRRAPPACARRSPRRSSRNSARHRPTGGSAGLARGSLMSGCAPLHPISPGERKHPRRGPSVIPQKSGAAGGSVILADEITPWRGAGQWSQCPEAGRIRAETDRRRAPRGGPSPRARAARLSPRRRGSGTASSGRR